jgi:LuxR family transcriptional regulator
MLNSLIPNLENELKDLRSIASAGFVAAFNMSFRGPEFMHSEYPKEWQKEYEDQNYYAGDPVLIWSLAFSGHKRWSQIKEYDPRNILEKGRAFGLNYGGMFSVKKDRKRSFLSIARSDRELTDGELERVNAKFETWTDLVTNKASLTAAELDVLRCLRDGFGQLEIAQHLGISESTVKQRAVNATSKIGARNRTHAVAIAVTRGILD